MFVNLPDSNDLQRSFFTHSLTEIDFLFYTYQLCEYVTTNLWSETLFIEESLIAYLLRSGVSGDLSSSTPSLAETVL